MADDISTEELLRLLLEQAARDMRVALPGRIESYDKAKQRANVRLELQYYLPDPDDDPVPQDHPVLQNVPVAFPQGGGYFCAFPLAKDDPVLVVFCDVPIGAWLQKGSKCEPGHTEMHGLGGAVCYPGLRPSGSPLQSADNALMRLGKDGDTSAQVEFAAGEVRAGAGASEAVAIASKVKSDMDALKTAFSSWVVAAQDGGGALKTLLSALIATPWPSSSYGSSNLKAKP